jgi:anti-sigma-K factor RskA
MDDRRLTCEETEELLPEYALDVLSAEETAAVVRHLHGCPQHAESLRGYEAACDGLCLGVPLVDPPARLKARVMAKVSPPARAPRRIEWRVRVAWAVAVIAAALAIVFGAWGLSLQGQIDRQAAGRNELVALSTQPDAHMVALETTAAGGTAKGVIIYTASQAAIWAVGLPALEDEQVYQCWWIDASGQRISGGTFRAGSGVGTWLLAMPDQPERFNSIGITIEPNATSTQPLGPKVMGADL